ncbi:hypothetical protein DP525_23675 [Salmonella enterica]|nr:hypothetical protein [Salmonella enterica]ECP3351475.1 hypothetical protein [Salmonella enterica]ECT8681899.1 hypothetical protein [Salmonella enterica subsp. enterica serovar Saintpaul]
MAACCKVALIWRWKNRESGYPLSVRRRKGWKAFCRENAAITVEEHLKTDPPFEDQADANWHVAEELTYWTN